MHVGKVQELEEMEQQQQLPQTNPPERERMEATGSNAPARPAAGAPGDFFTNADVLRKSKKAQMQKQRRDRLKQAAGEKQPPSLEGYSIGGFASLEAMAAAGASAGDIKRAKQALHKRKVRAQRAAAAAAGATSGGAEGGAAAGGGSGEAAQGGSAAAAPGGPIAVCIHMG